MENGNMIGLPFFQILRFSSKLEDTPLRYNPIPDYALFHSSLLRGEFAFFSVSFMSVHLPMLRKVPTQQIRTNEYECQIGIHFENGFEI